MTDKRKTAILALGAVMTAVTVGVSVLLSTAVVNRKHYPVFGVDVSNYQGEVDWQRLEEQGVQFAYIKATEGSGYVDESARRNIEDSAQTGIKRSCYHFFSFDSSGHTQAQSFIKTVGRDEIDLPPVVDIEYYGDKLTNKPSREEAEAVLLPLLEELEQYYGVKPMIYTTLPVYYRYVKPICGSDYPLWIRCKQTEPDFVDWTFWQYDDHGELDGYYGDERYIDFNVFNGTAEELEALTIK
ncbi:MAG: glycosyl hydrolase family 25 [Ruminococcus sp.]|nr:glycosyl hydrolase family 25 [Ruminococcus sp.]